MQLSIIVVNYNGKDILCNCVESIYKNSPTINFEIILVDNASSDGSVEMVKKEFPEVRVLVNQENKGFSFANNRGIEMAKGDYMLLLNNDTLILPGQLDIMLNFMQEHQDVGAVGPKLLNPDGSFQLSFWPFPNLFTEFNRRIINLFAFANYRFFKDLLEKFYIKEKEVDWVSGACLMVRRKTIEDVGILDENFFMYFEDVDWCYRIRRKGWKIYFLPTARIVHLLGKSMEKEKQKNKQNYRQSRAYFYRKYKKFYI